MDGFSGNFTAYHPSRGFCYECRLSHQEIATLTQRNRCGPLASRRQPGQVATFPTMSSILGAFLVQEAMKFRLEHRFSLFGREVHVNGEFLTVESYGYSVSRRDDCESHPSFQRLIDLTRVTERDSIGMFLSALGDGVPQADLTIEFLEDVVRSLHCRTCTREDGDIWTPLAQLSLERANCPSCHSTRMVAQTRFAPLAAVPSGVTLRQFGFPGGAVLRVHTGPSVLGVQLGVATGGP